MKMIVRSIVLLALSVLITGCGKQEWIAGNFPKEGFSATFPAPMISQPSGNTFKAWGHAGAALLSVTRVELEPSQVPEPGHENEFFNEMSKGLAEHGQDVSPQRTASFEGKPSVEFTKLGRSSDGKQRTNRSRIILVGKYVYVVSAQWKPDDKDGSKSAERFHTSFHLL